MRYLPLITMAGFTFLTACGSSSDDPKTIEPANKAPTIVLENSITADEKSVISISASANDPDGTIASYAWAISSGQSNLILDGVTTDTVTVTLPEVMEDTLHTLTLTVVDDDGDDKSASIDLSIKQLTIPLTLTGTITDSPIANANIQVQINGMNEPITASADANGTYSIDLNIDDSLAEAFVTIQANGTGEQSNAGLVSMLGTVNKLLDLTGDDSELSAQEYFALQVTNITTAQYALLTQGNSENITTDQQLIAELVKLDYNQVLNLAAAIKVAIDKSANDTSLALPTGAANTFDLVKDSTLTKTYLAQVEDSAAYTQAKQDIFSDPLLADVTSTWNVPEAYYYVPENGLARNSVVYFNSDHTGQYANADFTWQQTEGELVITMDPSSLTSKYETRTVNGQEASVEKQYGTKSYVLKRLSSSANLDTLLVTETQVTLYPQGEFADVEQHYQHVQLAFKGSPFIDIEISTAVIAFMGLDSAVNDDNGLIIAERYQLNTDGSATGLLNDNTLNWKVTDGALEFSNFSNEASDFSVRYRKLPLSSTYDFFLFEELKSGVVHNASISKGTITQDNTQWQADSLAGIYWMINGTSTEPEFKIWAELHADGGAEYYTRDNKNGGEYFNTTNYGMWSVLADGSLQIITGKDDVAGTSTIACRNYQNTGCSRYITYTLIPVYQTDKGMAAILRQDFDYDFFYTVFTVMTSAAELLEPKTDPIITPPSVMFDTSELHNQLLSVFSANESLVSAMNFAENGTFSDQRGETGTWLVNATGEIEAQWANNTSLVITPTAYTEDIKRYEIEWKVDNSQAITSVAYMRNAASLSFTSQELWGNTFYYAWYATAADCNVPGYVIEPISFASNGAYTLDNCDSDILENGTYNILENGNLRINFGEGEFVKKIAYNADIGGWLHCYEQVDSALCATNETGYFVASQADAQAYIDSKSN